MKWTYIGLLWLNWNDQLRMTKAINFCLIDGIHSSTEIIYYWYWRNHHWLRITVNYFTWSLVTLCKNILIHAFLWYLDKKLCDFTRCNTMMKIHWDRHSWGKPCELQLCHYIWGLFWQSANPKWCKMLDSFHNGQYCACRSWMQILRQCLRTTTTCMPSHSWSTLGEIKDYVVHGWSKGISHKIGSVGCAMKT